MAEKAPTTMTDQQITKLRGHYHSLTGQKTILDQNAQTNPYVIQQDILEFIAAEIESIQGAFPDLLPPFDRHLSSTAGAPLQTVRIYLASAIGQLRAEIESTTENIPVTQSREFDFIADPDLRIVLQRDYNEVQRAFISRCWKSVIILCGGAIEAILLDLLQKNPNAAKASPKVPKQPDLTRWDLKDLISVAVDCCLIGVGVEKLSSTVREFRNLIHPGNEVRNKLTFDAEEARIALEVLNIVHRELS